MEICFDGFQTQIKKSRIISHYKISLKTITLLYTILILFYSRRMLEKKKKKPEISLKIYKNVEIFYQLEWTQSGHVLQTGIKFLHFGWNQRGTIFEQIFLVWYLKETNNENSFFFKWGFAEFKKIMKRKRIGKKNPIIWTNSLWK